MDYVVTANWLSQNLDDPEVVVVDCRFSLADPWLGQQQYAESHIPGSYYLDLNQDLSAPAEVHGGRHPLPDMDVFAQKIAQLGVKFDRTLVVAYDDSKLAFAARLWWMLRYCGHDRVAVLDGGYQKWLAAEYVASDVVPAFHPGSFTPQLRQDWIVDIKTVAAAQDQSHIVLIDAREPDRYAGLVEPIDPVAGHIPGAVNFPWADVTDSYGFLLPLAQQRQKWADLQADQTKIVYCGSGVTACVNLLSLAICAVPNTILYPGSWSDWCSYL